MLMLNNKTPQPLRSVVSVTRRRSNGVICVTFYANQHAPTMPFMDLNYHKA
jgi:hypothetical protein